MSGVTAAVDWRKTFLHFFASSWHAIVAEIDVALRFVTRSKARIGLSRDFG